VPSRINEIEYQMERLKDPDYRAMLNKKSREYQGEKRKDLEFRTKVAEQRRIRYKEKMNGPVYRARLAAQLKERLRNPDIRARYNGRRRESYRKKRSLNGLD
jgi:hypothetical protein